MELETCRLRVSEEVSLKVGREGDRREGERRDKGGNTFPTWG